MAQNPHRHQCRARCRGRGSGLGAGGWRKPGNCTHGRCHGETNLAQQEPRRAASVQNSPSTPPRTVCAVQNSPCSPEMARFGAFSICRESFVPLSPPRSCAGRILYRTAELGLANRTPGPTCVEGAGGTGVEGTGGFRGTAWPQCQWITGPGRGARGRQQHPAQANFACNSPTTRIHARSKTAEYQRSDFNT